MCVGSGTYKSIIIKNTTDLGVVNMKVKITNIIYTAKVNIEYRKQFSKGNKNGCRVLRWPVECLEI